MTELPTSELIQILGPDGGIAGTGFLISADMAVTCTHVLAPVGLPVPKEASIRFHGATDPPHKVVVDPNYVRPAEAEDIVFLTLVPAIPSKIPLPLGSSNGTNGHEFETFGFPTFNADGGIRGDGHVLGKTSINKIPVLQIDSKQVTPGFSGAPVMDKLTGRIIGMVTKIAVPDEYGRLRDVAFITPSESLRAVLPALKIEDACPYRGLSSFSSDAEDVNVFCGRERLTSDLVAQLSRNPNFLAVVGPSGSGKSSVVNAGLVPAIREGKAGFNPEKLVVFPLSKVSVDDVLAAAREINGDGTAAPVARRIVFVLDELEQFFVASSKARESLVPMLAKLMKDRPGFTLVTAFRSDFYDPIFTSPLGVGLDNGQVNVRLMSLEELKSAIASPAASVGLRFSEGLVDDIAAEAAQLDNPLPLLEFALTQLWERRQDGELTRVVYRQMKGVAGSIASWATDAFAVLSESERNVARRILTRLIHYGDGIRPDTRKRTALANLISTAENQSQILGVVMKLATARILTTDRDPSTQQQTVTLIHDALITQWSQLAGWIKEQRQFLEWRQRLGSRMDECEKSDNDQGGLLRGQALTEAIRWREERTEDLSPAETAFVKASLELRKSEEAAQQKQEEQARRSAFRLKMGITAAALAIAALAGALWFWRASVREDTLLRSRQLVQESQRIAAREPMKSILLGVAGLSEARGDDGPGNASAQSNLHNLLARTAGSPVVRRQKGVNALGISPDGDYFAAAQDDESISVCAVKDASSSSCKTFAIGKGPILYVGFGGSNRWLAVGSSESWRSEVNGTYESSARVLNNQLTLELVDLSSDGKPSVVLPLPPNSVYAAAISHDGRWLVTGEEKGPVHVWNLSSPSPVQSPTLIQGHKYTVLSAAFSPDNRWLATGDEEGMLVVSQLASDGTVVKSFPLKQDEGRVSALAFSPDGGSLAVGTGVMLLKGADGRGDAELMQADGTVKIFDLRSGSPAPQPDLIFATGDDEVGKIAFSSDNQWLAAGSHAGMFSQERKSVIKEYAMSLRLWRIRDSDTVPDPFRAKRFRNENRQGTVLTREGMLCFAFAPDNNSLFSGSADGSLNVWDLARGNPTLRALRFNGHLGAVTDIANGNQLVLTASLDGTVRRWNYRGGSVADYPVPLPGDERGVRGVGFSKDGRWLAVQGGFATIRIWDMDKLEEARQFGPFGLRLGTMTFSPDGNWLLWSEGTEEGTAIVKVSALPAAEPLRVPGSFLAMSGDGRWMITGRTGGGTHLWDLRDAHFAEHRVDIDAGSEGVFGAVFATDGREFLTLGYDKVARFWKREQDSAKAVAQGQFTLPDRTVQVFLALSPEWFAIKFDPSLLNIDHPDASKPEVKSNTSVILFRLDFQNGRGIKTTLSESENLPVQNALISPDGRWLLTGLWEHEIFSETGQDAYARLYDLSTDAPGKHSVILKGHLDKLTAAAFSPDSKYLATGSDDGAVKLWPLSDILSGKVPATLSNSPDAGVTALEFDSNGKSLLASSKDGTARIWNELNAPGTPVVLSSSPKEVDQATLSPRGGWIATSGDDLSGWIWPTSTDRLMAWGCKAATAGVSVSDLKEYLPKDEAKTLCAAH